MNSTFTLEEVGLRDASRVGEEAASLGELLTIGAPVPAAFVVPTTSYAEYLNYPTVKAILGKSDPSDPEKLKAELLAVSLPKILEKSLRSAYRALSGPQDTFASVGTGAGELKALGEEELIYSVKKLWAEHLVRLYSSKESLSLNSLPILVRQIEAGDLKGHLFTSDPYSADRKTVVIEVDHHDGGEKFFFEKGMNRLTKRVVTGIVEKEVSLELVSSLSLWATRIEKLLGSPQELGWSSYQEELSFLWIKPLHLKKRSLVATKFWVWMESLKEAVPSEVEGIISPAVDDVVKLAKEFPEKQVLLALETIDENELSVIRRAKHKEKKKNLHLILPPARTVDGLREMKRGVAGEGLPRSPQLKFYFRVAFPANVVLLDRFLDLEMDGVVFDATRLTQGFLGTQRPVELDDSLLWALSEVQQGCRKVGADLLYFSDTLGGELLTDLLKKGVVQIVVNAVNEKALLSLLADVEGRVLEESMGPGHLS